MNNEDFEIHLNDTAYLIKRISNAENNYAVFTGCDKLFTLKLAAAGNWNVVEENVVPISENLFQDIGNAISEHEEL